VKHTLQPSDRLESDLRELCDGHLPDVVIDATGHVGSMSSAFSLVTHGGRLVYVGITTEEVHFKHAIFHKCEGTLLCSRNALTADFLCMIGLSENGSLDAKPWSTHRAKLDELIEVFPSYTQPATGVIKAIVEIDES